MDHPLIDLIDIQIAKAQAEGQFDDLPGAGKPLDLSSDAQDAVLARMLKEAGAQSPLVELKRQVDEAQAAVKAAACDEARVAAMARLSELRVKLALEIEAHRKYG